MQSVLKIGFVLAKKGGIGGGGWVSVLCTWQLPWLAVEKHWLALTWPFLCLFTKFLGAQFLALRAVFSQEKNSLVEGS